VDVKKLNQLDKEVEDKMTYIVNIQTGSRSKGNFTRVRSTQLPNKARVRAWIKRNPVGNSNTKISIKNTVSKKIEKMSKGRGYYWGRNIKR